MPDGQIKIDRGTLEDVLSELLADALEKIYESLQKRIEEAVTSAAVRNLVYRDVWSDVPRYQRNDIATHGGGLWIATRDDPGKPGETDSGWRLIVKRGEKGSKGDTPSLTINVDGVLSAVYPDGTTNEIGSIKVLIRDLLTEHGLGPREVRNG
jgi:hypothetical protein